LAISRTARPVEPDPTTVARLIFSVDAGVGAVSEPSEPDLVVGSVVGLVFALAFAFAVTRRFVTFGARLRGDGDEARGTVADGGTVGAVRGGAVFEVLCAEAGSAIKPSKPIEHTAAASATAATPADRPRSPRTTERGRFRPGELNETVRVGMRLSLVDTTDCRTANNQLSHSLLK
jgi:hypothetical protein